MQHGKNRAALPVTSIGMWVFILSALTVISGCGLFHKAPLPDMSQTSFINSVGMSFTLIKAGTFTMGSSLKEPGRTAAETSHTVRLTRPFYLQTTEVTQGQWKAVMGRNPSYFKRCGDECPVEQVSWNDTILFIEKLNEMEDTGRYRLPTEAEWEYACRARVRKTFYTGPCIDTGQANFNGLYPLEGCPAGDYRNTSIPCGSYEPNPWGLYDMCGNVWEWCEDWYGDHPGDVQSDPEGADDGTQRVVKGGAWNSMGRQIRPASRMGVPPAGFTNYIGFRVACSY
ncbi:MAG: formylglycine-generating enzyme family protein [Deltaproteobacteria bacterium]|nr:formylglycine-generating enzyme family protein [Deltaproteobacteria bacterium]